MDLFAQLAKDPHILSMLQGSGTVLALAIIKAWAKGFDTSKDVEKYRPYLEKGILVSTLLVAIAKAALDGHAADAPWDQIVNALMFFVGAKATGDRTVKKVTQNVRLKVRKQ